MTRIFPSVSGAGAGDFAHTPWDGSHPNFRIGLEPLGERSWIEVDVMFEHQLGEKQKLLATRNNDVFGAEPESIAAQVEVLEMVLEELAQRHGDTHRREGDTVLALGFSVDLGDAAMPPLEKAARLVQEDLVIMMKGEDLNGEEGWRLVAGCVCFPSSWLLAEKLGKPMEQVHAPVPQFGPGTKKAMMINRIFDKLRVEIPVLRINWTVSADGDLFHGAGTTGKSDRSYDSAFLRVEVQTLHKMARSGAILFTIRTHVDPLAMLESHPDRARLARGLAASLSMLDTPQWHYKGLARAREQLLARIDAIASDAV